MPVDDKHPLYEEYIGSWNKCRDCIEGEDAVRDREDEYLPKLTDQSTTEYNAYISRASFFNATGRTLEGVTGVVFRKDPIVTLPPGLDDWLDEVGSNGESFNVFAKVVFDETFGVGRHGVLLGIGDDESEEVPANEPPYLVHYNTEQIINWKEDIVNKRRKLVLLVLKELTYEEVDSKHGKPADEFTQDEVIRYRVLRINAEGNATKQVFRESTDENGKTTFLPEMDETVLKIRGKSIDYIPFMFFSPVDSSANPKKPPLIDIVNVNLSHWRNSADLEHGKHFTALPQPWVSGIEDSKAELKIGSSAAWVMQAPEARAGYLEFTGAGLKSISEGMSDKESQMAVLGARLLETPKRAVEAADTHRMRRSGEESITASAAISVAQGLTKILEWAAEWMAKSGDVQCELNTDYSSAEIDPQMLQTLMSALQSSLISRDTFTYNLQRGEILPEGRTLEEELDLIEQDPPMMPMAGDPMGGNEEDEDEDEEVEEDEDEDDEDT